MTSLIGIARPDPAHAARPGQAASNQAWADTHRERARARGGADGLFVEADPDGAWVVVGDANDPVPATRGTSASGDTRVFLVGRADGPAEVDGGRAGRAAAWAELVEARGLEAFRDAIGPYVAVVVRRSTGRLSIVRGVSGQRAMFLAEVPGGAVFATDAAALNTHEAVPFAPDPAAIAEYLTFGVAWGERTLARGVRRPRPGTAVTIDTATGALREETLALWPRGDEIADPREALEQLDAALAGAMRRAVEGPAPTALCLSAGLDSRTLLAVAARAGLALDCTTSGVEGALDFRLTKRMCDRVGQRHLPCLFDAALYEHLERWATEIAGVTQGEADFMNMMMLYQGTQYRELFGLRSVIRGHGGELMKLSDAYGFSVSPEEAAGQDHAAARAKIMTSLSGSASLDAARPLVRGELADALEGSPARSFTASYDRLAAGAAHVGQAVSLMFLTEYNGRHTANAVRCMTQAVDVTQPILDEDVVSTVLRMPIAQRTGTDLQVELIRRNTPALLRVPNTALGVPLTASTPRRRVASLWLRAKGRLGLGHDDVPEEAMLDRIGALFDAVLLDERVRSRDFLDADRLAGLVARSRAGERRLNTLLGRLAILELMLRRHD